MASVSSHRARVVAARSSLIEASSRSSVRDDTAPAGPHPGQDSALAPGMDVGAILRHADGSTVKLVRGHSDTAAQLSWLTRGSALNLFTTTERSKEGTLWH